jgi:hypothetical protein
LQPASYRRHCLRTESIFDLAPVNSKAVLYWKLDSTVRKSANFCPDMSAFRVRINRKGHHPLMPAFAFKPNHLLVATHLDFHASDVVIACLGRLHDEDQSCLRIASDEVADIYRRVPVFAKARSDRAGICFVKRFPGCRRFLFLCMRRRLSGEAG